MSLPDERVLGLLRDRFVVGWWNNDREAYCGTSRGYAKTQSAVGTTNGAGGHNVQMLVLSEDLVVLHALPGFWHPEDLAAELRFALVLDRLWRDPGKTRVQKARLWELLHRAELRRQPAATTARSEWQSFDRLTELGRSFTENLDTVFVGADGPEVKPLNHVVHERLLERPFVPFEDFDVAAFVDYGKTHYDNNAFHDDRSRRFVASERAHRKREIAAARAAQRLRRGR